MAKQNTVATKQACDEIPSRYQFSFSQKIILGVLLGILSGVLFGEQTSILRPVGLGYLRLMQMAVLPYIVVSLIRGIGSMRAENSGKLAIRGGLAMGATWLIVFVMICCLPLAYPEWTSASFFSTSVLEDRPAPDFVLDYIPSNPFNAMANGVVPPVVLFCILLGIALIRHPRKNGFFEHMDVLKDALATVTSYAAKLTPLGIFALMADAAGKISVSEIMKIQVYVLSVLFACVVITYVILPLLITACIPVSYKEIVTCTHSAMLTAFTTGSLLLVVPALIESAKHIFRNLDQDDAEPDSYIDIVVPVIFNFPNCGKLIVLVFILFASWFNGSELSADRYPQLLFSGFLSFFGSETLAIPFLLDTFQLPADLFGLFVIARVITQYFSSMLGAMAMFTATVLSTAAMTGKITLQKVSIFRWAAASVAVSLALVLLLGTYFRFATHNEFEKGMTLARMHARLNADHPVDFRAQPPDPKTIDRRPLLERIRSGSEVRIAYIKNNFPFSFVNAAGETVGFDIDMATDFANHLGCGLILYSIEPDQMYSLLENGSIDAVFSTLGIAATHELVGDFTQPVMDLTAGFAVPDFRRHDFVTLEQMRAAGPLRIASLHQSDFELDFIDHLPKVEIIKVKDESEYFEGNLANADAMIGSAESLAAWTLIHSNYTVVVPKSDLNIRPAGFLVANGNQEMRQMIDSWLYSIRQNTTYRKLYDHWILGQGATNKEARWSLIRYFFGDQQ